MLQCLISGKLTKPPARRTSQGGTEYVTACILANAGKDESYIVNAVAFSDSACDAIMGLQAGDGVSIAGSFKPSGWQKEDGTIGISVSVIANTVLTTADAKAPARNGTERQAQAPLGPAKRSHRPNNYRQQAPRQAPPTEGYPAFDDEIPF